MGESLVPSTYYIGGNVNDYYNVNKDLVSYFEILGMVKELGYNDISKLYYRSPYKSLESGLRLIYSDKDTLTILEESKMTGNIIVYVEHNQIVSEQNVVEHNQTQTVSEQTVVEHNQTVAEQTVVE